jgi:hypothetical protein
MRESTPRGYEQKFSTQLNLHLEKSISGCCAMNLDSMSCFFCSSEVGLPIACPVPRRGHFLRRG